MQQFLAQASSNSSAASPPASPQPRLRPQPRREPQHREREAPAAMADDHQELARAFSGMGGLGVDETVLVSALGRWRRQPEKRGQFRRSFPGFFSASACVGAGIELCEDEYVRHLKIEFSRFKSAMVLWAMHPWERDARWAHHVLHKAHPPAILVEVACTRSADELLGARRAYQALYHRSLEEDVAYRAKEANANLLVGLVSAYRYEGPLVSEELAKEEAKALGAAVKSASASSAKLVHNEQVVRVLATRSKPQLRATFRLYKELHGKPLEEDFAAEPCLEEVVKCLDSPAKYFAEVINGAFKDGADKQAKAALTRAVVSRSDADMEEIKDAYAKQYGAKLADAAAKNTHGHYKDALLAMIGK
ncbi:annexin D4-like isoform X2 [Phragmites australis]|uniref:annexin D4-like isoform X2 n=1 Tax=Phragmites australis TaxID=29695 RepID=UPI002D78C947|nr:annexin D4-like isoform X2 [Phragmites australis]